MSEESGEKKYDPTQQKIKKAKQQGNYLKLPFAFSVVPFFVSLIVIAWSFPWIFRFLVHPIQQGTLFEAGLGAVLQRAVLTVAVLTVLPLVLVVSTSIIIQYLALRPSLSFQPLVINFQKVSAIAGVKRVSKEFIQQLQLISLRFVFAIYFCWSVLWSFSDVIKREVFVGQFNIAAFYSLLFFTLWPWLLVCVLAAIMELLLRMRSRHKELSMTEKEMRDENKEMEGDPYLKAERKQQHVLLSLQELEKRVRSSKVIIIN